MQTGTGLHNMLDSGCEVPASVPQSAVHPISDQEFVGSIPAGNIFSWGLIMIYFLQSSSPFH